MNIKKIIGFCLILVLFSCSNKSGEKIEKGNNEQSIGWSYQKVGREYFDSLLIDICSTPDLEFIDLYPIQDSILHDKFEKLYLVTYLKTNGFKVTDWGRGNWMKGPRIVSYTMLNEECNCMVDKLYYTNETDNKYKVTERIRCRKINNR
jgi:hypothetical protein